MSRQPRDYLDLRSASAFCWRTLLQGRSDGCRGGWLCYLASYWRAASVQRITVERSLPDPRLTFQADIADTVMSLMPGLMMDFPGPGKLKAAAGVATAESEVKYFEFESAVLQTAFAFKKAWYQLSFLEGKLEGSRKTLRMLGELERLALMQNEVGKVTMQDVLWARIEQERLITEIANLDDSRHRERRHERRSSRRLSARR